MKIGIYTALKNVAPEEILVGTKDKGKDYCDRHCVD